MNKKSFSGRQKIPIEKIPKKSNLQVTFSKRRLGLFKKASELCTLCGVEIAIVVFSPANKAFSFGHPEVESIIDRYLARNLKHSSSIIDRRNSSIHNLNIELTQILSQLEIEKKKGKELDQMLKDRQRQFWWERSIDELGLVELQQLMISMEELKREVFKQNSKILMDQRENYGFGCYYDGFENKQTNAEINASSSSFSALPNDAYELVYPTHGHMNIF